MKEKEKICWVVMDGNFVKRVYQDEKVAREKANKRERYELFKAIKVKK